jgi:threonine-phosphate decarboxylase
MIHGHGNHISQYPNLVADFSSNVWYQGTPGPLLNKLKNHLSNIKNYPEPDAMQLRQRIARFHRLDASHVLVTNGSTEAFYLIAQAFTPTQSIIVSPCFAEYHDACLAHKHKISFIKNELNWYQNQFNAGMVWLANPNNPDGKTINGEDMANMLRQNPNTFFVLDEAYLELCSGLGSFVSLLTLNERLIVIRSFTKAFAIPGIRLGYILASKSVVARISKYLMPWNVNSLALVAGNYIMDNYHQLLPDVQSMYYESQTFQEAIKAIPGLTVYPSCCNFFLVQLHNRKACGLKQYLIDNHGLLIRDASNFKGLDESFFRVALQSPQHNQLLIQAIRQWMH